jgi:hypothetical protein
VPIDRKLENNWDKQLEERLPDSRTRTRKLVQRGQMWWEPVYCANCGELKGLITPEFSPHIHYVCDVCYAKMNGLPPPGMIEGPRPPGFVLTNGRLTKD